METLRQDIRYAARTLWKARGFAFVAIVTLALGIGASTAIFSVMDNVLMEPFPYVDAQRYMTVLIHDTERNEPGGRGGYSGPEFLDIIEQNHVFDRVIANDQQDVLYRSGGGTELFKGSMVTPGTFEFMGMPPQVGRVMQPADYEPGAPPVFVMRYKTWVTKFSADPGILGKTFVLNDTPRTLIGVMPPRFGFGDSDVWIPAKPDRAAVTEQHGFPQHWFLMGHLKPGSYGEASASRSRHRGASTRDEISERLSETLRCGDSIADRSRRRPVPHDALHHVGGGGFAAVDRLRQRRESSCWRARPDAKRNSRFELCWVRAACD